MTQAQLNFYDEALRQLTEALKPETTDGAAKRRDKSTIERFIREKGLINEANI